jgi:hypothetical protein
LKWTTRRLLTAKFDESKVQQKGTNSYRTN